MKKFALVACLAAMLSACGGGGGGGSTPVASGPVAYSEPALPAEFSVAQQCTAPRPSGTLDPFSRQLYGDIQGSLTTEKLWVRVFVNDTYLWYQDVVALDPALFVPGASVTHTEPSTNNTSTVSLKSNLDAVQAYFNSQRSLQLTASGKPKDQFHFTYLTEEWVSLSTAGSSVGFGFELELLASYPPRKVVVAYAEPGSPAALNNMGRGAQFVSVNGVLVSDGDPAVLNEGLFSPVAGKPYTFQVLDQGSSAPRTVTLTAGTVVSTPVQNVRTLPAPNSGVGYMQFNDHMARAESQLIAAVQQLKSANNGAGITDLVLDLRYNGGGFLDIASELAYMIAGPAATVGKTFEKTSYNNKNPFQQTDADTVTPFHALTQGFSTTVGQALPHLALPRVFVITGKGTCSASEAIINGLNGAGIKVILMGGTSCGKPYGFYPQDNCSVTYFTIQFKGVNQAGFGDYADGFSPGGTGTPANQLPGCVVADDFTKPLGDPTEARLAAALLYRDKGLCPPSVSVLRSRPGELALGEPLAGRSKMRENRFYRPLTRPRP